MMQMSRVTSKYQVTIPNEIRYVLKVEAGDRIMFRIDDDGEVHIRTVKKISVDELAGALHREGLEYVPFDEVRRVTQEEISQRFVEKENGQS